MWRARPAQALRGRSVSKAARKPLSRAALGTISSVLPGAGAWLAPFTRPIPHIRSAFWLPALPATTLPAPQGRPLWKDAVRLPYRVNSDGAWTPPAPATDHTR